MRTDLNDTLTASLNENEARTRGSAVLPMVLTLEEKAKEMLAQGPVWTYNSEILSSPNKESKEHT